jgi:predicted MFS family arabinose efflux permease
MATGLVVISSIRQPSICTPARDDVGDGPSSVSEGLGEIRSRPRLWQGLVLVVFVMLAVGSGAVGLVVLGDEVLGMGEEGFSILLAALAVGTLFGAIAIGSTGEGSHRGRFLVTAALLAGLMLVLLARVDQGYMALGVMFVVGIAAAMVLVPFTTMLQEDLGDTVMGTGFGLLSMGLTTPLLVGVAVAGPLIDQRGVLEMFTYMGIMLVAVGVAAGLSSMLWSGGGDRGQ